MADCLYGCRTKYDGYLKSHSVNLIPSCKKGRYYLYSLDSAFVDLFQIKKLVGRRIYQMFRWATSALGIKKEKSTKGRSLLPLPYKATKLLYCSIQCYVLSMRI